MAGAAVSRQAEEALRRELRPGEHVAGRAVLATSPSRWAQAAVLVLAAGAMADGLLGLFGPQPGPPGRFAGLAPLLAIMVMQSLRRPVLVVVTGQRLLCWRLPRLGRRLPPLAFAVPLADVRIVKFRAGRLGAWIWCQLPGQQRIRLESTRAGRKDFEKVNGVLAEAGAYTGVDPPWPSAASA